MILDALRCTPQELLRRTVAALAAFLLATGVGCGQETKAEEKPGRGAGEARPPEDAGPQAGLSGLYVASRLESRLNLATNLYEWKTRMEVYFFRGDGNVYYGLPRGGRLNDFDFARARREDAKPCGVYRIQGGQIIIDWPDWPGYEKGTPQALELLPGSIRMGGKPYLRVEPVGDLRWQGTFGRRTFVNTGNQAAATEGGISGDQQIEFTPDGRFTKQGFTGLTVRSAGQPQAPDHDPGAIVPPAPGADVAAAASERKSGSGSYRLGGYALELTYDDGTREYFTFFRFPREENRVICIDGTTYLRRE